MTKGVGMEVKRNGAPSHRSLEEAAHRTIGETAPALVDEEGIVSPVRTHPPGGSVGKVDFSTFGGSPSKRNNPLFAPFAPNSKETGGRLDIGHIEGNQLTNPQSSPIKKLDNATIPPSRRGRGAGLEQHLDGVERNYGRCGSWSSRVHHRLGRVCAHALLGKEEAIVGS